MMFSYIWNPVCAQSTYTRIIQLSDTVLGLYMKS